MEIENSSMHSASPQKYLLMALAVSLFFALAATDPQEYTSPHSQPGPAVDTINFSAFAVEIASRELEAGNMDLYLYSLKTAAAEQIQENTDVKVYQAPATTISVVLNPAPAPEGELNPLSINKVRQALQYVVNRSFVSQEIYKGFALPMLTHISPSDFDFLTVYNLLNESNISYDPQIASEIVTEAMTNAGAQLKDELWHYNGQRIDLKFIVRTEDERWEVGNALAAELKKLGFSVNLIPQQFGPAVFTVYGTDPQLFQWHLYTEGWGRGAPERYDYSGLNHMCAPWLGNMPGWQEVGFWQYESKEIDDLGQKLFTGNFSGLTERNEIYSQATNLCLEESLRLWVATAVNNFPSSSNLQGVTEDAVAGPKSIWTLREAYLPGKSELNVGNLWISTNQTTWNPVGGFGDVYSNDIWKNITDPPITNDPFTGVPAPFRVIYEVETAGPHGTMDIPSDAVTWNPTKNEWAKVNQNTTSTSRVTFDYSKYFQSKWHHGETITMADVVYPIARLFDMVYDEDKSQVEFSIATTSKPFTDTIKGFRILDDHRLEVYVNYWHFQEEYIAQYSNISGLSMPWEINAAMDHLVFNVRKGAYTDTSASRFSLPWLNLVVDNDARLVRNTLREFSETSFMPKGELTINGKDLANEDQAKSRFDSAINWFSEKGHMVVGNGPFYLETFRGGGEQFAQIKAFRDPDYPFQPGDLYRGKAPSLSMTNIERGLLQEGRDFETTVSLNGPGNLGLRFILQDASTGEIIRDGQADNVDNGQFKVTITSDQIPILTGDFYTLSLAAYTDELSVLLERKLDIQVGSQASVGESEIGGVSTEPSDRSIDIQQESTTSTVSITTVVIVILGLALTIGIVIILAIRKNRNPT